MEGKTKGVEECGSMSKHVIGIQPKASNRSLLGRPEQQSLTRFACLSVELKMESPNYPL